MDIKKIRIELGMTQKELAERLGLSGQSRISEYENGKRKPSKRIEILIKMIYEQEIKKKQR
jgi:transcriptional regulator with XRE-family HTH domain